MPPKKGKTKTAGRKPSKPRQSFNQRVRKVLAADSETKMKIVNIFNQQDIVAEGVSQLLGTGLTNSNLLDTLAVAQGSEQEERQGNKISSCRLTLRGVIQSNPYALNNPSNYPYEVHMVFYKEKKSILNDPYSLKSLPNNQTGEISGELMNSVYPYNKDKYIIRKIRVFRLRPLGEVAAPGATVPETYINQQWSNNPAFHRFVETVDIHKDLRFNDNSTTPANDWCAVSFYVINGDGQLSLGAHRRAKVTMDAVLTFKDM